jgi:hypothetical protein
LIKFSFTKLFSIQWLLLQRSKHCQTSIKELQDWSVRRVWVHGSKVHWQCDI